VGHGASAVRRRIGDVPGPHCPWRRHKLAARVFLPSAYSRTRLTRTYELRIIQKVEMSLHFKKLPYFFVIFTNLMKHRNHGGDYLEN